MTGTQSNNHRLELDIGFITGLLIINMFLGINSTEILIPTINKSLWSRTEKETDIFFLGGNEIFPVCVYQPDPVYPEKALASGLEGLVVVWVYLDEVGTVNKVTVYLSSGHPSLDEAAVKAAFESRWTPAQDNGEGVRASTSLAYNFSIDE